MGIASHIACPWITSPTNPDVNILLTSSNKEYNPPSLIFCTLPHVHRMYDFLNNEDTETFPEIRSHY